jgi:hypothetical protein
MVASFSCCVVETRAYIAADFITFSPEQLIYWFFGPYKLTIYDRLSPDE